MLTVGDLQAMRVNHIGGQSALALIGQRSQRIQRLEEYLLFRAGVPTHAEVNGGIQLLGALPPQGWLKGNQASHQSANMPQMLQEVVADLCCWLPCAQLENSKQIQLVKSLHIVFEEELLSTFGPVLAAVTQQRVNILTIYLIPIRSSSVVVP